MKYMQRKSMLYKTGVEYGDYTMNHVQGCSHGCKYPCYAFLMAKRFGKAKSYEEWCEPTLAENTLEILAREIPRLKNKIKTVQLCFTTDPFMVGYPEVSEMSIAALRMLNDAGVACIALTKGVLPDELLKLSKSNTYGISLISLDEQYREQMEPGAAPYAKRIASLRKMHNAGFKTWVSMEPYPTPNLVEQDLDAILDSVDFADKIIFGRTNYSKNVSSFKHHKEFYNECALRVIAFCEEREIDYHIKDGTLTEDLVAQ